MNSKILTQVSITAWIIVMLSGSVAADTNNLEPNKSTVLLDLEADGIRTLTFASLDGQHEFSVSSRTRNRKETIAGGYYLKKLTYYYGNVRPLVFNAPTSDVGLIPIAPQTVTYLGDWLLKYEYLGVGSEGRTIDYSFNTLQKYLKADPSLADYPLRIATDTNGFMVIDWNEVINYKKP